MSIKSVSIRTLLPYPPNLFDYWWGEEPGIFQVGKDGVLEGLTVDHPRFSELKQLWRLEVVEVSVEDGSKNKKDMPEKAASLSKEA